MKMLGMVATVSLVAAAMASVAGAAAPSAPDKLVIDVPNLAAGAPNPTVPAPEKRKMICRTDYQIGSLVKKVRRCGDASMWARSNRANRDMADVLQQSGLIQQQEGADPSRAGPVITQGYSPR